IGCRAQLQHLGIKAMQLLPQPIRGPTEFFKQRFFRPTQIPQHEELRGIPPEAAETGAIRAERISQDKSITPIILGAGHTMAVTKPIELLGINRKNVKSSFH